MPLAHILAPQIAKKAAEIEAALSPSVGFLSRPPEPAPTAVMPRKGGQAVRDPGRVSDPVAPSALGAPAPAHPLADPTPAPSGPGFLRVAGPAQPTAAERALRALREERPNSPFQVFKNAAILSAAQEDRRQKGTHLLPNAPVLADPRFAAPGEPIGVFEDGRPAFTPGKTWDQFYNDPKNDPRKPRVIPLPKGAVGIDETGQAVDKKGKKLGFLNTPAMVTPHGDLPMRTADRRAPDVSTDPKDEFDAFHLQQMFGKHLKAMQENRDADGMPTDKFPEGHFKGMSKKERESIIKGVEALRALERGTRT